MLTLEKRIRRRWMLTTIFAVAGFFALLIIATVFLFFTLFVAFAFTDAQIKCLLAVDLFLLAVAYFAGWQVKGLYQINIDTIVRDMGDLQKRALIAALQSDLQGKDK